MRTITLPDTDVTLPRIVFGTASLFNLRGERARARLLDAAVDHGLTHFDTAPLYGFGLAETALGVLMRRHPKVTVTTKVGLYAPGGEDQPRTAVFARKALGRAIPALSGAIADFSVARARHSLDASLRRLNTDRIALYMLHEPVFDRIDRDEWTRWLENEVRAGRIGAWGIAADDHRLAPFLPMPRRPIAPGIVQTTDSLDRCEADALVQAGHPLQITYGYVSAARARGSTQSVAAILEAALRRNAHGAIIASTRQEARLAYYPDAVAAADRAA